MSAQQTLFWTERLIGLAATLQTIELLQVRRSFDAGGIWDWNDLRGEYARPARALLGLFLGDRAFALVLVLRLLSALALVSFGSLPIVLVLFMASLLVAVRFRGLFNGGSDTMTVLILGALVVARAAPASALATKGALAYVGAQVVLSYFVAGVVKLKEPRWRDGTALRDFLLYANYDVPLAFREAARAHPALTRLASWGLLAFECAFPLVLADSRLCTPLLALGLAFHLGCFAAFGLNRFVFAWLAGYPAVRFLSMGGFARF